MPLTWNPCHLGKIHLSKDEEALVKKKPTLYMLRVVSLDLFWSLGSINRTLCAIECSQVFTFPTYEFTVETMQKYDIECHRFRLSCLILIINLGVVSPILNVNPTLFVNLHCVNFFGGL